MLAQNPRIYLLDNGNWCVQGQYRDILEEKEEEEEVEWSYTNGKPNISICLVSDLNDSLLSYYLVIVGI